MVHKQTGVCFMLALMTSVYTALKNGVSCAVSRAWPDRDPILPSLSFRLLSWNRQDDGSALAVFAVQIRAINPAYCDELAEDAEAAMLSIGFALSGASDDVEPDTGFPLKLLEFSAVLGGVAVAPMTLSIYATGAYRAVNGLSVFKIDPAEAPLISSAAASSLTAPFLAGRVRLPRLTVSGLWIPADAGQLAVATVFSSGASASFTFARSPLSAVFDARVMSFAALPSGFTAALQIVP